MSDEIFLGGKTYVSSKRAASSTGYAQDYIGQLARAGLIDAQRVGGLWYVFPDSLEAYKRNAEASVALAPTTLKAAKELDTVISFDGKEYVSSGKAAKLTGYNPDYVGQLARAGKVLSRQIGNRWYIERNGLLAHKSQKDALLASVQAESAGLVRHESAAASVREEAYGPYLTYISEDAHLFPQMAKPTPEREVPAQHSIPIRVVRPSPIVRQPVRIETGISRKASLSRSHATRTSGKRLTTPTKAVAALTVVIVLSYGLVSLKSGSTYAVFQSTDAEGASKSAMTASVGSAVERIGAFIESIVAPELTYTRAK